MRRYAVVVGLPALFVFIWSSGYLVGEIGTSSAPPFVLLFWRFAVAGAVLAVVAVLTRAPWPREPKQWLHLAVTGVLLQTVQFGAVYLGLTFGMSAGLTSLIVSASPLAIAAAAVPLFAERLRPAQWAGLLLGLAGVALAVATELSGSGGIAGLVAVLVGATGFVAGTLYQKRFGQRMDLRTGSIIQALGATIVVLPLALVHDGGLGLPLTAAALGSTAWLSVINSIGGFTLLFVLLRRRGAGAATSYLFLVPPATALIAVPLLGQPLIPGAIAGIALSAVGVAMVTRQATRTPAPSESAPTGTTDPARSTLAG